MTVTANPEQGDGASQDDGAQPGDRGPCASLRCLSVFEQACGPARRGREPPDDSRQVPDY